ncbi:MAG: roadblock/LC7 domain-containing protein [Pseudoxanthomonas suwonensis]|nr:roadblock/LC7 domain-containing protein [Pseudoxanthomonas suwonensis]
MPIESQVDRKRFQRYFPLDRENDVQTAISKALDDLEDGHALVLSTMDGQRIAYAAPEEMNTSRLAAITGSLCALGETLGRELGMSGFNDVMVQMGTGLAVVQKINGQRLVLMSAAGTGANLGLASSHTRYCAETLGGMCFTSRDRI